MGTQQYVATTRDEISGLAAPRAGGSTYLGRYLDIFRTLNTAADLAPNQLGAQYLAVLAGRAVLRHAASPANGRGSIYPYRVSREVTVLEQRVERLDPGGEGQRAIDAQLRESIGS